MSRIGTRQPTAAARRSQACRRTCPSHDAGVHACTSVGACMHACMHLHQSVRQHLRPRLGPANRQPLGRARTRAAGRGEECRRSAAQ